MLDTVNEYLQHDATLLSEQDLLQIVRPLCEDIKVERILKLEISRLPKHSFELSKGYLIFFIYQKTDWIVSSNSDRKLFWKLALSQIVHGC